MAISLFGIQKWRRSISGTILDDAFPMRDPVVFHGSFSWSIFKHWMYNCVQNMPPLYRYIFHRNKLCWVCDNHSKRDCDHLFQYNQHLPFNVSDVRLHSSPAMVRLRQFLEHK
nr:unnamed protein product [Callosobruchus analis]